MIDEANESRGEIQPRRRVSTGIPGLDDILGGGLTADRLYLLEGTPGTGKTTLSVQFLRAGAARGERGLYVTLSETAEELRAAAATHGWSLDAIEIYELVSELGLDPDRVVRGCGQRSAPGQHLLDDRGIPTARRQNDDAALVHLRARHTPSPGPSNCCASANARPDTGAMRRGTLGWKAALAA